MEPNLAPIMENFSDKKRGRPAAFTPRLMDVLSSGYGEGGSRTRRHVVNRGYYLRAFRVLGDDARFAWLMWEGRCRHTLITELGRIGDTTRLLEMAALLCERKPRTQDGVVMIRRWRLGTKREGESDQLADELCRGIDAYLTRYPKTRLDVVRAALDKVFAAVLESDGKAAVDA